MIHPQHGDHQTYHKHLASELKRINSRTVKPQIHRPASPQLKRDLLDIHRRNSLLQDTKTLQKRHRRTAVSSSSPESLKRDLLDIHHRKSLQEKKKRRARKIQPVYEHEDGPSLPNTALDNNIYTNYNKDYLRLSKEYKRLQKYRIHHRSESNDLACVKCRSRRSRYLDKIFFPCEHRCVCNACLDRTMPRQCPVCNEAIRFTGSEHEEYWKWVDEVKPSISSYFIKSFFVQSKDAIRSAMADTDDSNSLSMTSDRSDNGDIKSSEPPQSSLCCWKLLLWRRRASRW